MYLSPIDVFLSLPLSKKSNVNIFASEDRKIASLPSEEVPEESPQVPSEEKERRVASGKRWHEGIVCDLSLVG